MKLNIRVSEPAEITKKRTLEQARKVDAGQDVEPLCEIGFEDLPQFFETLTPKRWELIAALKEAGPLTIYALAKRLDRHYRNVYRDIVTLTEWMLAEKDDQGRVFVPWDEIDLQLLFMRGAA